MWGGGFAVRCWLLPSYRLAFSCFELPPTCAARTLCMAMRAVSPCVPFVRGGRASRLWCLWRLTAPGVPVFGSRPPHCSRSSPATLRRVRAMSPSRIVSQHPPHRDRHARTGCAPARVLRVSVRHVIACGVAPRSARRSMLPHAGRCGIPCASSRHPFPTWHGNQRAARSAPRGAPSPHRRAAAPRIFRLRPRRPSLHRIRIAHALQLAVVDAGAVHSSPLSPRIAHARPPAVPSPHRSARHRRRSIRLHYQSTYTAGPPIVRHTFPLRGRPSPRVVGEISGCASRGGLRPSAA